MVEKLKSALQTPYLPLLLNTALFALLLFWFSSGDAGVFSTVIFSLLATYLYTRHSLHRSTLWPLFFVFILLAIFHTWESLLILSWFLLGGLERFLFVERQFWLYVLVSLLLLGVLSAPISDFYHAVGSGVLAFAIVPSALTGSITALLIYEFIIALHLLPLDIWPITILSFLLCALIMHYAFYRRALFAHSLIFIVFSSVLFLTSRWSL